MVGAKAAAAIAAVGKGGEATAELIRQAADMAKGTTHIPAWMLGKRAKKGKPEPEGLDVSNGLAFAALGALALFVLASGRFPDVKGGILSVITKVADPMNMGGGLSNQAEAWDRGQSPSAGAPFTIWCWRRVPGGDKTLLLYSGWNTEEGANAYGANFGGDGWQVTNGSGQRVAGAPVPWANDSDIKVTTRTR